MSIRLLRLIPSLAAGALLALAGCSAESSSAGSGGGKADDLAECDDGICLCGDGLAFVDKARVDLTTMDAAFYPADAWSDDDLSVEYLGDLDGDGVDDPIVGPGRQYSGGSFVKVVYLTGPTGCPSTPAAVFEARDLDLAEGETRTNGVYDLRTLSIWDCEATVTNLVYDGKGKYVETAEDPVYICEEEGDSGLPEDGTEQPE